MVNQEWQLAKRPAGMPTVDCFKCGEADEPKEENLKDGEVLVELAAMSVDPYMRGRMNESKKSYIPCFEVDQAITGYAAAKVLKSKCDKLPEGSHVAGFLAYRMKQIANGAALQPIQPNDKIPITQFLGGLGMPGLTAYLSIKNIGEPKEGETAFVTGGGGAVGSTAIQIFKAKGLKVIACAGTDEKVQICKDLGADVAFNYKTVGTGPELEAKLTEAAPKGINIYYDNVGGRYLEAALNCMAQFGRIILCGAISEYNIKDPSESYGIKNLFNCIGKSLKMQGFIVSNYPPAEQAEAVKGLAAYLQEGKLVLKETVVQGFDKMPAAFVGMLSGDNTGKMVIKV